MEFSCKIPVIARCDVFVAGGGPAGTAAVFAASKCGAKVFLAEKTGCFGGMGTAGLVPFFTGETDGVHFLCGGFGREIFDRMKAQDGFSSPTPHIIRPEILKRIYDKLMLESGAEFSLECDLVAVQEKGGTVTHAIVSTAAGLGAVEAAVFIDATGDGNLSALSGAQFELGDERGRIMPSSLCSLWSNIDWEAAGKNKRPIFDILMEAIDKNHFFKVPDRHHTGMRRIGASTASANIGHIFQLDSTDPKARTSAWLEGRRLLPEFEAFYRARVPGFEKCELTASASMLGIRESRRILGDYVLSREDYIRRARFDDAVGCFAYGVDIHPYDPSPEEFERFRREFFGRDKNTCYQRGEHYMIPYRILTVKGFRNLLTAGRCVSADKYMEASIRVMPGCFITGQAAGIAAALALKHQGDVRGFEICDLQKKLRDFGGFLEE